MTDVLISLHSGFRWIVLIALIAAIVNAIMKSNSKAEFTEKDAKLNFITAMIVNLQVIGGLVLYFISDKVQFNELTMEVDALRFFAIEHIFGMILATALISIGNGKSKRKEGSKAKFKATYVFYGIGLVIILLTIPWPFREALGGGWF